jgi:hypothetical protein
MLNCTYEFLKLRDTHFGIPTYNSERSRTNFDFYFKFQIPKPNKERLIVQIDELGRIIKTKLVEI